LLGYFEENMLKMNYEEIVHFLNELPKTEFFNNPEISRLFMQKCKSEYRITDDLMEKLENEHNNIIEMASEYKVIPKSKERFVYYIGNKQNPISVNFPN